MRRAIVMLCLCLLSLRVFAQALPVTPMQNAVSGVMQAKMKARGFASNDPRFGVTLQGASSAIAGAAASAALITAAGITAPAWVTAGIGVGLATALGYAINLAIDAGVKWLFNSDGTVTTQGAAGAVTAPVLTQGGPYYVTGYMNGGIGSSPTAAAQAALANPNSFVPGCCTLKQCTETDAYSHSGYCTFTNISVQYPYDFDINYSYFASGSPYSSSTGSYAPGVGVIISASSGGGDVSNATPQQAVDKLTDADKAKALNPQIVAALANQAWQQAASQPGYTGLPYDATNPITSADAAAWQSANPSSWPTVGDAVAPQPAPSGGTAASPWQLPNSSTPVTSQPATQTPTTTNPGTGEQLNLGPDPNIGAPTLEATPTAQAILQPLLDLFPSLRNFVVPSHGGDCPKPSADLFGKRVQMDGHCALLEPVRGSLSAVMAFVWVMLALLIVLAA